MASPSSSPPPDNTTTLTPTEARAGQRVGLIRMLAISTGLAVVVLAAVLLLNSRRMHAADVASNAIPSAGTTDQPVNAAAVSNPYPQSR